MCRILLNDFDLANMIALCQIKYPYQDLSWIQECSKNQLDKIRESLIKDHIDYDSFYSKNMQINE